MNSVPGTGSGGCLHWGLRETEHPKELTGILAHKFGEGRTGVICSAHSRLGGHRVQYFSTSHSTLAKLGLTSSQGRKGREGAFWRCHNHNHWL